jgi:hypothetical protein
MWQSCGKILSRTEETPDRVHQNVALRMIALLLSPVGYLVYHSGIYQRGLREVFHPGACRMVCREDCVISSIA